MTSPIFDSEAHCNKQIPLRLEDVRPIWSNVSDTIRLEILKSVIWTSPDNHDFYAKAMRVLKSEKFRASLD